MHEDLSSNPHRQCKEPGAVVSVHSVHVLVGRDGRIPETHHQPVYPAAEGQIQ